MNEHLVNCAARSMVVALRAVRPTRLVLAALVIALPISVAAFLPTNRVGPLPRPQLPSCGASGYPAAPATATTPTLTSGNIFASHGRSGRVSILSLESGTITSLGSGATSAHEVAVSPDGRWGVVADFGNHTGDYNFDGRRLIVVDLVTKTKARTIDLGASRGPHDMVFLPGSSSRLVVTTQTTRNITEVDVASGRVLGVTPSDGISHMIAVAADGRTAYTSNEIDGTVSQIDLGTRVFLRKYRVGRAPVEGVAVTPDGREVWAAYRGDSAVRALDASSGGVLATIRGFPSTERMAISPDGRRLLVSDLRCREVKVIDVRARRVVGTITDLSNNAMAQVLPDNRLAVVPLLTDGVAAVVDIEQLRVLARHRFPGPIDGAAWGPVPSSTARD